MTGPAKDLVLASASPRREALLRSVGLPFRTRDPRIDEGAIVEPTPIATAEARAEAKARAVRACEPTATILAADTVVALGGEVLDKAKDVDDVVRMVGRLSGRTHLVYTSVALIGSGTEVPVVATDVAEVTFRELSRDEVERYAGTGEGVGKAGGYAVQGVGGRLVAEVRGDRETVIGLPTRLVASMLREIG